MTKRTALITGATSGIGEAVARLLAKQGYTLILVGRREDRLIKLSAELDTESHYLQLDISDKQMVSEKIGVLLDQFQSIELLINNAGVEIGLEDFDKKNQADISTIVDTNITGLLNVTYPLLKSMRQHNLGHIVNIGSCAAYTTYRGGNVYGATKAFVRQFSRNLRMELVGTNIKVTNIEPGSTRTELAQGINNFDMLKASKHYDGFTPLTPQDIANTILWAIEQPKHVNIDNIEIMCIDQASGGLTTHKIFEDKAEEQL